MAPKSMSGILWTLVSINFLALVFGGLVTWLGYAIPARLKQFGLLPELVVVAGFGSLIVACIGLCGLNYSSYHALNIYGFSCSLFVLMLLVGLPDSWYKSSQFKGESLFIDIIYYTLLILLLILLIFAFVFSHHLKNKEMTTVIMLLGKNNSSQNDSMLQTANHESKFSNCDDAQFGASCRCNDSSLIRGNSVEFKRRHGNTSALSLLDKWLHWPANKNSGNGSGHELNNVSSLSPPNVVYNESKHDQVAINCLPSLLAGSGQGEPTSPDCCLVEKLVTICDYEPCSRHRGMNQNLGPHCKHQHNYSHHLHKQPSDRSHRHHRPLNRTYASKPRPIYMRQHNTFQTPLFHKGFYRIDLPSQLVRAKSCNEDVREVNKLQPTNGEHEEEEEEEEEDEEGEEEEEEDLEDDGEDIADIVNRNRCHSSFTKQNKSRKSAQLSNSMAFRDDSIVQYGRSVSYANKERSHSSNLHRTCDDFKDKNVKMNQLQSNPDCTCGRLYMTNSMNRNMLVDGSIFLESNCRGTKELMPKLTMDTHTSYDMGLKKNPRYKSKNKGSSSVVAMTAAAAAALFGGVVDSGPMMAKDTNALDVGDDLYNNCGILEGSSDTHLLNNADDKYHFGNDLLNLNNEAEPAHLPYGTMINHSFHSHQPIPPDFGPLLDHSNK